MLVSLSIQGLALVSSVELTFDHGLNVLTGETGAGKSLVLGSIGLLLGERADADWLRAGEARGSVEAIFDLSGRPDLLEALASLGVENEEGRITLRREIHRDGKARAFVNARAALVSQLKGIGDLLVDLHGQHEHQLLLIPARQADFFDEWAGLWTERRSLEHERDALLEERRHLRETRERWERDRAGEATLREDFEELRQAALDPDEEGRLRASRERAQHRERILQTLAEASRGIGEEDHGAAPRMKRVARALRGIAAIDSEAEVMAEAAERVLEALDDLGATVERAENRLEGDASDLESVEGRLDLLHRLKRKHRTDLAGLIVLRDEWEARVRAFDPSGRELERAEHAHDERLQAFERRLDALTEHRNDRFGAFERAVGERLSRIGFGRAALRVRHAEADRSRAVVDPVPIPTLEFAFQPNPGESERPLRRIASGGELSRVMLAIKSLMAERDQVAVLVFDEVDQGIGGAVGDEVGRLLRSIGERRQVLCITHLPLIAAHGARHFEVRKMIENRRTSATVRALDSKERVAEVARLLAGDRVTETTKRQARELLESAQRAAAEPAPTAKRVRVRG